ncbi:MAG: hypothetical protein H7Z40_02050 [Phycisphaerae bacterium]|nr:hypothetical protein [Gemmatimonadaceae bacterium]
MSLSPSTRHHGLEPETPSDVAMSTASAMLRCQAVMAQLIKPPIRDRSYWVPSVYRPVVPIRTLVYADSL